MLLRGISESTANLIYILAGFDLDFAFMLESGDIAKIPRILRIRCTLVSFRT